MQMRKESFQSFERIKVSSDYKIPYVNVNKQGAPTTKSTVTKNNLQIEHVNFHRSFTV